MDNHGFASVVGLKEINIGHEDKPRLMYVSIKSNPKNNLELINLLEVGQLNKMLGLDRSIV